MSVTLLDTRALRREAAIEPDPVPTGEVTKETQIIAIYGKGGSGKSFAQAFESIYGVSWRDGAKIIANAIVAQQK